MFKSLLSLLLLCAITLFGAEQPCLYLNNIPQKSDRLTLGDGTWSYQLNQDFGKRASISQDLHLSRTDWKQHPVETYIAGVASAMSLRFQAPGTISTLKVIASITNYEDDRERQIGIDYSFNGVDFTELASQPFKIRGTATAQLDLPKNKGFLWLRIHKKLTGNDDNGHNGYVLFNSLAITMTGSIDPETKTAQAPSLRLKDVFPTGVFWPWERTKLNAEKAGMDLWPFVEAQMKQLKEHGFDTIWFVNLSFSLMPKVLLMAEQAGLKVLLNPRIFDAIMNGFGSVDYMDSLAQRSANELGAFPSLLGYVLRDEPNVANLELHDYMYHLLRKYDPKRDATAVIMNRPSVTYLQESDLPVICSDIYYFGHDRSTNIPNPAVTSQADYTNALKNFGILAQKYGKHTWVMGQMFSDIWGRHYVKDGKMIVYPGSYLHWRMPTVAESRWQIWEAVRNNSKGIFFYVLFPDRQLSIPPSQVKPGTPEARQVASMDRSAKSAASWGNQWLTETIMEFDPGEGCVQYGGKPTPQMTAIKRPLQILRAHEKLLLDMNIADCPMFFPGTANLDCSTFDTGNGKRYGVIVNRNLNAPQTATVLLPVNAKAVTCLNDNRKLDVTPVDDHFKQISLTLEAGDGALLEAEFNTSVPAIPICRESFNLFSFYRTKLYGNSEVFNHGTYGVDMNRSLRLTKADGNPVLSIQNLIHPSAPQVTFTMNLNRSRKDGTMYLLINGRLRTCTVKAIADNNGTAKANVNHLADKNFTQGKQAHTQPGTTIKDADFKVPAIIPVGTTAVDVYLHSTDDYITDLSLWFVPNAN